MASEVVDLDTAESGGTDGEAWLNEAQERAPPEEAKQWAGSVGWWWTETFPAQWAILDTNALLDHLEAVRCVVSQMTGVNCVVPRMVLQELEALEYLGDEAVLAQHALGYIRSTVQANRCSSANEPSALVMQKEDEVKFDDHLKVGLPPTSGDHVLACVRYFASIAPDMTELLTTDRSLSIKAASCGIPSEPVPALMARGAALVVPELDGDMDSVPTVSIDETLFPILGLETSALVAHSAVPCTVLGSGLALSSGPIHWTPRSGESSSESDANRTRSGLGAGSGMVHRNQIAEPPGLSQDAEAAGNPPGLYAKRDTDVALTTGDEGMTEESSSPEASGDSPPLGPCARPCAPSVEPVVIDERAEADDEWAAPKAGRTARPQVVLRGLPFTITEAEVLAFVRNAGVRSEDLVDGVVLLANAQGRPSGFAEIHLSKNADFWQIRQRLHMQTLGERYIEALPPRPARKAAPRQTGRRQWRRDKGSVS